MTEKDYAPQKNEGKKMVVNTPKKAVEKFPVKKKVEDTSVKPTETDSKLSTEEKVVEKPEEKKPIQKKPKKKKTEAFVNETSIPISTKHSTAICKFIKGKKIEKAISDLEKVIVKKKAVPMKGEIPHRKGMMSGRYPKKASEQFIKTLKRLKANAIVNEIENPMIVTAIANLGSRPYGKFGRVRKKRTHLKIIAKETKEKIVKKEAKKE